MRAPSSSSWAFDLACHLNLVFMIQRWLGELSHSCRTGLEGSLFLVAKHRFVFMWRMLLSCRDEKDDPWKGVGSKERALMNLRRRCSSTLGFPPCRGT